MKAGVVLLAGALAAAGASLADAPRPTAAMADAHALPLPPDDLEDGPADPAEDELVGTASGTQAHRFVTVKVVADLAYRQKYPNWRVRARNAIESADYEFAEVFGIDLLVVEYRAWESASSRSCVNGQLPDLTGVGRNGKDLVIGFTARPMDAGGCTYNLGTHVVIGDQRAAVLWKVIRHEVSHDFGAWDRYLPNFRPNPNHADDVMEDPYNHPTWWSAERGDGDRQIIHRHKGRFD